LLRAKLEEVMSGTIDSTVERERDRKHASKDDARKGPGNTGPAQGSGIPDDDGEAMTPSQPRSTKMAGQKP
jgi:hypothetical protein